MSEKTLVFDNGNDSMMGLIASLCQQRGLDPNMVAAMMNNRGNGYGDGGWWIWIIVLLLFGWGGFGGFGNGGFGGNGMGGGIGYLGNLVNNDAGRELLMSAIQGNGNAIQQLATTLHCDQNALTAQISNLQTQLCNIGNSVGMSSQQVINAINSGNCQLGNQLAQCCCNIQDSITRGNYENQISNLNQTNTLQGAINFVNSSVERGFSSVAYERAAQTCALSQSIADANAKTLAAIQAQTTMLNDKFCQLEFREMQRENQTLRDQVQAYRLSDSQRAQTTDIVSQLQPIPRPSYLVPNPYGCGCNNYGYQNNNGCNNGCCNC